jgi:hypothetical protein
VEIIQEKSLKYRRNLNLIAIVAGLVLLAILVVLTLVNYRFSLQSPGGNDFLVNWEGTRLLIKNGLSPYSDQASIEIQKLAYGHPAHQGEVPLRMTAPLYAVVFFLPFALIKDFALARALWTTTLQVSLLLTSYLSIRLVNWKSNPLSLAIFFVFSFFWYHSLSPVITGNTAVLATLFIVGAMLAIRSRADEFAGVLLAFATIKIQLVLLLMVLIIYWSIRNGRLRIIYWILITLALLALSATLLVPNWVIQNASSMVGYLKTSPPGSFRDALKYFLPGIGERTGLAVSFILALVLLIEWSLCIKAKFRGLLWTACLTLVASQWIGLPTVPENFVILLPAAALVFSIWQERWHQTGALVTILISISLAVGLWLLYFNTATPGDPLLYDPVMFFPAPAIILIMLYWVRWWAFQEPKVWFDEISALEKQLHR